MLKTDHTPEECEIIRVQLEKRSFDSFHYIGTGEAVLVNPNLLCGKDLQEYGPYVGILGEVLKSEWDVHAWAMGRSYFHTVKFGGVEVKGIRSSFLDAITPEQVPQYEDQIKRILGM